MAQNDVIILNSHFENWLSERAQGLGKIQPFLFYAVDQITKSYGLTDEQVLYGLTDSSNDGTVDAIYCLAGDSHTLIRDEDPDTHRGVRTIRILIFQIKSSLSQTGFKPSDIDEFSYFTDDLLRLDKTAESFSYKYNPKLLTIMRGYKTTYLSLAKKSAPTVFLDYYYVTRGDEEPLLQTSQDAIDRLEAAALKHIGMLNRDRFTFKPLDTQGLYEFVKKRRRETRQITWKGLPIPIQNAYLGLVRLSDYFNFLLDDEGKIDELIFESNVRGNQGNTTVNRQIGDTLKGSPTAQDFWRLNNGITITCASLKPIDAWSLSVADAQVVNGLQTSRQIYEYLQPLKEEDRRRDDRSVLVKLMAIEDNASRDAIIRATNNQNSMKASAIRGTDQIHREIEILFQGYGLFYDRRPGFYKDQLKPINTIVSMTELVEAALAILLRRPNDARGRPGDYLRVGKRGDRLYKEIFGTEHRHIELLAYLQCVRIVRRVREFIDSNDRFRPSDAYNLVFYVALHATCRSRKCSTPSADHIVQLDTSSLTDEFLEPSLAIVNGLYIERIGAGESADNASKGPNMISDLNKSIEGEFEPCPALTDSKWTRRPRPKDVLKEAKLR